jgi:hypothetical protein
MSDRPPTGTDSAPDCVRGAQSSVQPPPVPRAVALTVHLRLKGGKLQQLVDHPCGGRWRWWIDVPTVPEDAADVIPG